MRLESETRVRQSGIEGSEVKSKSDGHRAADEEPARHTRTHCSLGWRGVRWAAAGVARACALGDEGLPRQRLVECGGMCKFTR